MSDVDVPGGLAVVWTKSHPFPEIHGRKRSPTSSRDGRFVDVDVLRCRMQRPLGVGAIVGSLYKEKILM